MIVMVMMVMMMLVVVVVMSAVTVLVVIMVMMIMVVMMLMVIVTTVTVFIVIMVMMVVPAVTVLVMIVVMMLVVVSFLFQMSEFCSDGVLLLHGSKNLLTGNLLPRCRYNRCLLIVLTHQGNTGIQLVLGQSCCMTQNNRTGMFNLIVKKLTKILHVHLRLFRVYDCGKSVQLNFVVVQALYSENDIAEFANA